MKDVTQTSYIINHSRKIDKKLKYDFLPDMIEIIERPSNIAGKIIIISLFLFLIIAVVWAACSEMDVVVTASGIVEPEGGIETVYTKTTGSVEDVIVEEGEYVSKGDPLVAIDTEFVVIKIYSPESGYVTEIQVRDGGDIYSGQEIMKIVPEPTTYEMTCQVDNGDIADIKKDADVDVKLKAYPYSEYGTIPGKVTYVSPTSEVGIDGTVTYSVKVKLKNTNKNIDLKSGLSGTAELKIGKRTVLSYFLEPITDGFKSSLKEK